MQNWVISTELSGLKYRIWHGAAVAADIGVFCKAKINKFFWNEISTFKTLLDISVPERFKWAEFRQMWYLSELVMIFSIWSFVTNWIFYWSRNVDIVIKINCFFTTSQTAHMFPCFGPQLVLLGFSFLYKLNFILKKISTTLCRSRESN